MIYKKLILNNNQKIWFTSDTHFSHKNICRGTTEWSSDNGGHLSLRDFEDFYEMNDKLIGQINKYVDKDDWLIHLGDFSFGGKNQIELCRNRINCDNIVLILGNHDHNIANDKVMPSGKIAQSLFESVHSYLELTVSSSKNGKQKYNLFHFPIKLWNKAHHNIVHLFGHVHGSLKGDGRSLDVGMDNAHKLFGEYRPFSQEDIFEYMKGEKLTQISHHNKNTN